MSLRCSATVFVAAFAFIGTAVTAFGQQPNSSIVELANGQLTAGVSFHTHGLFTLNLCSQDVYCHLDTAGHVLTTKDVFAAIGKEYRIPTVNVTDVTLAHLVPDAERNCDFETYRNSLYEKFGARTSTPSERIVEWASPSTATRLAAGYYAQQHEAATNEIVDMVALELGDALVWQENCLDSSKLKSDLWPAITGKFCRLLRFPREEMQEESPFFVKRDFVTYSSKYRGVQLKLFTRPHVALAVVVNDDFLVSRPYAESLKRFDDKCSVSQARTEAVALRNTARGLAIQAAQQVLLGGYRIDPDGVASRETARQAFYFSLARKLDITQSLIRDRFELSSKNPIVDLKGSSAEDVVKEYFRPYVMGVGKGKEVVVDSLYCDLSNYRVTCRFRLRHSASFAPIPEATLHSLVVDGIGRVNTEIKDLVKATLETWATRTKKSLHDYESDWRDAVKHNLVRKREEVKESLEHRKSQLASINQLVQSATSPERASREQAWLAKKTDAESRITATKQWATDTIAFYDKEMDGYKKELKNLGSPSSVEDTVRSGFDSLTSGGNPVEDISEKVKYYRGLIRRCRADIANIPIRRDERAAAWQTYLDSLIKNKESFITAGFTEATKALVQQRNVIAERVASSETYLREMTDEQIESNVASVKAKQEQAKPALLPYLDAVIANPLHVTQVPEELDNTYPPFGPLYEFATRQIVTLQTDLEQMDQCATRLKVQLPTNVGMLFAVARENGIESPEQIGKFIASRLVYDAMRKEMRTEKICALIRQTAERIKGKDDDAAHVTDIAPCGVNGVPALYVNGINTSKKGGGKSDFNATEQAEALSIRIARAVNLVHNPSASAAEDSVQAIADRLWCPLMPQHNNTTRRLGVILRDRLSSNGQVSIVSHSQGCIIVRNALATLAAEGYDSLIAKNVRWTACGAPFRQEEVMCDVQTFYLNNDQDPVNVLGQFEELRVPGLTADSGINVDRHDFVKWYVFQIEEEMLWSFPSGTPVGKRHDACPDKYDRWIYR